MPAPKAGTSGRNSGAEIVGLRAFTKELRKLEDPRTYRLALGKLNREIAKKAEGRAQSEAEGSGPMQRHHAREIRGRGSQAAARLAITGREGSDGAFYGAKQFAQFDEWVGKTWQVAVRGQGPYAINVSLAEHIDEYAADYGDGFMDLAARAFPDRT